MYGKRWIERTYTRRRHMRRRDRMFSGKSNPIWDMGSLINGSVVVGLAFAFGGPFITLLIVLASIVYGSIFMLNLLTPKSQRKDLLKWG